MSKLTVVMIDVGAGDSILVDIEEGGRHFYGLIDSNDSAQLRSSFIYLKRYFERQGVDLDKRKHLFEFVLATHEHSDHAQGLKAIMQAWGTKHFWYPESLASSGFASLLKYAMRSSRVRHYEALDTSKKVRSIGSCLFEVLWPPPGFTDSKPNNNSVVMRVTNGRHGVVLTGDAEEMVWRRIARRIPTNTLLFKVPHHGSINGTLDGAGLPLWLNQCPAGATLAMSTHIVPHDHPDKAAVDVMMRGGFDPLRTDRDHHIIFSSNGTKASFAYTKA